MRRHLAFVCGVIGLYISGCASLDQGKLEEIENRGGASIHGTYMSNALDSVVAFPSQIDGETLEYSGIVRQDLRVFELSLGSHAVTVEAVVSKLGLLGNQWYISEGKVHMKVMGGKKYLAKASLMEGKCMLWVEDADTGEPVSLKVDGGLMPFIRG